MSKEQLPLQTFPEDSPGWASMPACTGDRNLKDIAVYMHKEQTKGLWEIRFRVLDTSGRRTNLGWDKDALGCRLAELGLTLLNLNQEDIDESEELEFGF